MRDEKAEIPLRLRFERKTSVGFYTRVCAQNWEDLCRCRSMQAADRQLQANVEAQEAEEEIEDIAPWPQVSGRK